MSLSIFLLSRSQRRKRNPRPSLSGVENCPYVILLHSAHALCLSFPCTYSNCSSTYTQRSILQRPQDSPRARMAVDSTAKGYLHIKIKGFDRLLDLSLLNGLYIHSDNSLCDLLDLRRPRFWHRRPQHGSLGEASEPDRRLVPDMETTIYLKMLNFIWELVCLRTRSRPSARDLPLLQFSKTLAFP